MLHDRPELSVAPFRFDITPPPGHALLAGLVPPVEVVDDPLEAIGYVLLGSGRPIVVCALDWAGTMNSAHIAWRAALAEAAGTTYDRVAVHCVHQHNAPFVCPEARELAGRFPELPAMYDPGFLDTCFDRARQAVRAALPAARPITHLAHGAATVRYVASNRRVQRDASGRVGEMRTSACRDPALVALPEGTIDPELQTVAFYDAHGTKVLAAHYYATHPMSFYRDGRVTSDFCGLARKRLQAEEPACTHLYFTGCAGNVAAGKYNDGSAAARTALTDRIYAGILAAARTLAPQPITRADWRVESFLPRPLPSPPAAELAAVLADRCAPAVDRLLAAFRLSWHRRCERGVPLELSRLRINDSIVLHLPGEMFVEYQLRARAMHPGCRVAVAAYGDDGLWYVPTKEEYAANGYEVQFAFSREEIDGLVTDAMRKLIA